jgi:hypothetical protein
MGTVKGFLQGSQGRVKWVLSSVFIQDSRGEWNGLNQGFGVLPAAGSVYAALCLLLGRDRQRLSMLTWEWAQ